MNKTSLILILLGIAVVTVVVGRVLVRSRSVSSIVSDPSSLASTTTAIQSQSIPAGSWKTFVKPSESVLRSTLTPLQYQVTQEDGTERPYANEYADNHADGLYVDRVSGEPLFSSKDKYESGTGWPSFVKPIDEANITYKTDGSLFLARTEVRSRHAGSHLGHVFTDGPADRGGKRYCMNSAALRFIPKGNMEAEGYGAYLSAV